MNREFTQGVLALSAAEAQEYALLTQLAHNRGGVDQLGDVQQAQFAALTQKLAVALGNADAAPVVGDPGEGVPAGPDSAEAAPVEGDESAAGETGEPTPAQ